MDNRPHTGQLEPDSGEGDQWASSDLLVLKGLSNLDEAFSKDATDGSGLTVPVSAKATPDDGQPEAAAFRTAREMKAAQERQAALERLAIRRKEGETGGPPTFEMEHAKVTPKPLVERSGTPFIAKTPPEKLERPISPPPKKVALAPSKETGWPMSSPPHPESRPQPTAPPVSLEALAAKAPAVTARPAPQAAPLGRPLSERESQDRPKAKAHDSPYAPPTSPKRVGLPSDDEPKKPLLKPESKRPIPQREVSVGQGNDRPIDRPLVLPQDVRRRVEPRLPEPKRPPFASIVFTSVILTTLVWAGLIAVFWEYAARDWLDEKLAVPTVVPLIWSESEMPEFVLRDVAQIEGEVGILTKQFNDWVRLNAMAQGAIAEHDRDQFDEFTRQASLMAHADMVAYLRSTRERIVKDYRGLASDYQVIEVNGLFPGSDVTVEGEMDALELAQVMKNPDHTAPVRARAAFLIREFGNDHQVQRTLVETIRTEKDLRVVMAAWDSLTTVTGYETPNDFDVDHFLEWWEIGS